MTQNTESIRAEIDRLEKEKRNIDAVSKSYDDTIRKLEIVLTGRAKETTSQQNQSYVQLAICVLEELGRPTPISVLLERIRARRNDPTITRGSVETSLLRHLNSKGDKAYFIKPGRGIYALRTDSPQLSA
jgi:hypothetical protein